MITKSACRMPSRRLYGVMTLFGIIPAAMAWQQRYGTNANADGKTRIDSAPARAEMVPGGQTVLLLVAAAAAYVIVSNSI